MDQRPRYINLTFGSRTCVNKLLYIFYKLLKLIYTACYYYFLPFFAHFAVWMILMQTN